MFGSFVSVPLDNINLLLDNFDLVLEFWSPILEELKDLGMELLGAIPGVGTVVSVVDIVLNLVDQYIFYFMEEWTDIISLIINVSRKEWTPAFVSLLEVIPELSSIVDASITNLRFIRKNTDSTAELFSKLNFTDGWEPIFNYLLENSDKLLNEEVILLNPEIMEKLSDKPLLKFSLEQFYNLLKIMKPMIRFDFFNNDEKSHSNNSLFNIVTKIPEIPILSNLNDSVTNFVDSAKEKATDFVEKIPVLDNMKDNVTNFVENAKEKANDFVENSPILDNMKDNVTNFVENAKEKANDFVENSPTLDNLKDKLLPQSQQSSNESNENLKDDEIENVKKPQADQTKLDQTQEQAQSAEQTKSFFNQLLDPQSLKKNLGLSKKQESEEPESKTKKTTSETTINKKQTVESEPNKIEPPLPPRKKELKKSPTSTKLSVSSKQKAKLQKAKPLKKVKPLSVSKISSSKKISSPKKTLKKKSKKKKGRSKKKKK